MLFARRQRTEVKTVVRQETVVREIAPPAPVAEFLEKRTLKMPPGTKRVFLNIQLAKGSAPVKAHVIFRDVEGRMLPAEEDWFTVKKGRKRSAKGRGMAVPPGAVYAALEIGKAQAQDACKLDHLYFSQKEEDNEQ